ncbi:MAG: GspE/PulE family protein [Candidatus Saccharibacteria bacterium]
MAMPNPVPKLRLGELLVQAGAITEAQLNKALQIQKRTGAKLGETLVREGMITQTQLATVLETQLGIHHVDLKTAPIDPEAVRRIPENVARRHVVVPIQFVEGRLLLAMKDPLDRVAIQDVTLVAGMPVTPILAGERDIMETIESEFGQKRAAQLAALDVARTAPAQIEEAAAAVDVDDAPMVRLVNSIIENAVRSRASDIHIEPKENELRVRTRVDGILHEALTTDPTVHSPMVSRLKVMAEMNIAERRLPQDGKFSMMVDKRRVDLRVSTMPTVYGEKVVIRILDRGSFFVGKEHLGFSEPDIEKFNRLVNRPWGIILVTGPTGSGKTTTLYSMLSELDGTHLNVVTLEDPVEYEMTGISQTQINAQAGFTFAAGIRTLLRQDPDVIMVGEIRDSETADISVRAALTGHLVLSTLHTTDAPGAVARMMDMGIEPYLIASSLGGIVAQRLVRKVCQYCKEEYEADSHELEILGVDGSQSLRLTRGKGCKACRDTGYLGRIGVFEVMEVDRDMRELIGRRVSSDELREFAIEHGMIPLWNDCRLKVINGITTLEEALRVTQNY